MRRFWVLALGVMLMVGLTAPRAALAQEILAPKPGIEATIQGQIDAFLIDDFVTAFTFASPNIQRLFGSPENFGAMVRRGYPMVWRPSDVQFGDLRSFPTGLYQQVIVTDVQGVEHYLEYQMIGGEGSWRIAGVQIIERPNLNA